MEAILKQLEITGVPPYVGSWSAVSLPGFIGKVMERWQRNFGNLPPRFLLVACPLVEVNAIGGLPARVRELTDSRIRILHFTGCHKPYLIILLFGDDAEERRNEIQQLLSWSEGYEVRLKDGMTRLRFIEAIEESDLHELDGQEQLSGDSQAVH